MQQTFAYKKERHDKPGEFAANMLWLKTNWHNYNNRWVALNNGNLIVSAAAGEDIANHIDPKYSEENILFVLVGRDYIGSKND